MNKIACFLVLLTMLGINAAMADETDRSTDPVNLVYYPHRHDILLTPQTTWYWNDNSQSSNVNGGITTSTTSSNSLSLSFNYGLTDRLLLAVSLSDLMSNNSSSTSDTSGKVSTSGGSGLSDPNFTLAYRLINGENGRQYLDVSWFVDTSFGPQVESQSNQTGNNRSGAWSSGVALPYYAYCHHHEYGIVPQISHYFGGVAEGDTESSTRSYAPRWNSQLTLEDRYHFLRAYYLQPQLVIAAPYSSNSISHASPSATSTSAYNWRESWSLAAGWEINPQVVVATQITYQNYTTQVTPGSGLTSQTRTNLTTGLLNARIVF